MSSLSFKRYHCHKYQPKEHEIHSPYIVFTVNKTKNKLIGVSKKEGEDFRAFAYFTDNIDVAKRAILMDYKMSKFS